MARRMKRSATKALAESVNKTAATGEETGWTVKAYGKNRGEQPSDAFMVALPREQVESPLSLPTSPADIQKYQRQNRGLLKQKDLYHGGWVPKGTMTGTAKEGDYAAHDVSRAYPRTEEGMVSAMRNAVMNKQTGIGNVGPDSYETVYVPKHLSSQFWPEKMQVSEQGGMVSITPSLDEMVEVEGKEAWRKANEPKDDASKP